MTVAPADNPIRLARLRASMSQGHLADASGLSERTVKRAEAGHAVSPETARALAGVLSLDAGSLLAEPAKGRPSLETTLSAESLSADPRADAIDRIFAEAYANAAVIVPDPSEWERTHDHASDFFYDPSLPWDEKVHSVIAMTCTLVATGSALALWATANSTWRGLLFGSLIMMFYFAMTAMDAAARIKRNAGHALERRRPVTERIYVLSGADLTIVDALPGMERRETVSIRDVQSWTVVVHGRIARHDIQTRSRGLCLEAVPASCALDTLAAGWTSRLAA